MGNLLAGGTARLTFSLRPAAAGASFSFNTAGVASAASRFGEVRHAR